MLVHDQEGKWLMYADEQTSQIFGYQEDAEHFAATQEGLWIIQLINGPYGTYHWKAVRIILGYEQLVLQGSMSSLNPDQQKADNLGTVENTEILNSSTLIQEEIINSTEVDSATDRRLYKKKLLSSGSLVEQDDTALENFTHNNTRETTDSIHSKDSLLHTRLRRGKKRRYL